MATDLAAHLASRGWDVEAITSRLRYDDPTSPLDAAGQVGGVRITRIPTTRFGRRVLVGRLVDYATFYLSAFFAMLRRARRGTIVVAMTDPPLLSVVAAAAVTLRGATLVNWLHDLYPEVAEALGLRATRVLRGLRNWSLRRAKTNVVLGDRMAVRVPNAIVRHNWADAGLHPIARDAHAPFTVAYSGNLGRAHDVATIASAIRALPDVRFVFTGSGARWNEVPRTANVETRAFAPREKLSESLADADVHLVSLQPALEGLIVPSKFYGVLAAARPMIFIGAADGELARIIDTHRCGIVVAAGDADALVRAIRELAADRRRAEAMGQRGRALYLAEFAPERALPAWERILEEASR
jgi:glycosyltransferase involved in cell wall biosynthesis